MTIPVIYGPLQSLKIFAQYTPGALSTMVMNSSTRSFGTRISAPKTGTITHVGFMITAITGSPPAYSVGVVAPASDGKPGSTAVEFGGSQVADFTPAATGWTWVELPTGAAVTRGDTICSRIRPGATAPSATDCMTVAYGAWISQPAFSIYDHTPFVYDGSWTSAATPTVAFRYSDGAVAGLPFTTSTSQSAKIGSNSTPDEVGGRFVLPADISATEFMFSILYVGSSAGNITWTLYDASDNVLWTRSDPSADWFTSTSGGAPPVNQLLVKLGTPIAMTAATVYRLSMKIDTTYLTGGITLALFSTENESDKAQLDGGTDWKLTYRTDAGAWTDVNAGIAPVSVAGDYTPAASSFAWGSVG